MSATKYVATTDIYAAPGVLAYRPGDEVPASALENLQCKDKVAPAQAPAAKAPAKSS